MIFFNFTQIDQSYLTDFSPITAFGIFDGHNGPEVAEHCSHLTPYLLSLELQRHILSSSSSINRNYSKCIPDILAEIFHRLNKSVNSGRAQKVIIEYTFRLTNICIYMLFQCLFLYKYRYIFSYCDICVVL